MRRGTALLVATLVGLAGLLVAPLGAVAAPPPVLTWSSTGPIDGSPPLGAITHLQAVSCPSAGLCVAVDPGGNVLTSTAPTGGASTWKRWLVDPGTWLAGVSCPTTSLCVAGDGVGDILVSTNPTGGTGTWSKVSVVPGTVIDAVSCPTASFCVAADQAGDVITSTDPTGGNGFWSSNQVDGTSEIISIS